MTKERTAKSMATLSGYKLRLIAQNTNNETARAAAIDEINRRNKTC
jgi:hypothetical protein